MSPRFVRTTPLGAEPSDWEPINPDCDEGYYVSTMPDEEAKRVERMRAENRKKLGSLTPRDERKS